MWKYRYSFYWISKWQTIFRKCISFRGEEIEHKESYPKKAPIHLEYELSPEQKELSDKLVENYKKGIDSLVYAVCGSGKTEISLGVIQYAIECGEKVAFAVPRRDVVIELHVRLKEIFKNNKVIAVYGGHNDVKDGDIIVLTTHQLYRYKKFFSLIVLDEIDAFPFKGDEVLRKIFFNALKGHYIMMSATPTKDAIKLFQGENKDILRLDTRFHRHPLPVPQIIVRKFFLQYISLYKNLKKFVNKKMPVFIFCPTISECEKTYYLLSLFIKGGEYVHSKRVERSQIIDNFRKGQYRYLVTTSVLERGVTLKNLQVIVFKANHPVYDDGTLVQIAGRSGRKKDAPEGEVIFICNEKNDSMQRAIASIENSNKALQDLLQGNK